MTSDTAVHRGQRGTPAGFSPTDITGGAVCHSSDSDDSTLSAAVLYAIPVIAMAARCLLLCCMPFQ